MIFSEPVRSVITQDMPCINKILTKGQKLKIILQFREKPVWEKSVWEPLK